MVVGKSSCFASEATDYHDFCELGRQVKRGALHRRAPTGHGSVAYGEEIACSLYVRYRRR